MAKKKKEVKYVQFGITSAKQFWTENVMPAYEKFKAQPNSANAITASIYAWQILDWIWHDQPRVKDTRHDPDYGKFRNKCLGHLPELAWIRDVANAGKHRGLGDDIEIRRMKSQAYFIYYPGRAGRPVGSRMWRKPLTITLNDDSEHDFAESLAHVIEYWQKNYFA
jgi:hypothetical protein